jgi:hypothetical protein
MTRTTQAKYSFAGGVRTPRVSLRSDHNVYTEKDSYNESLSQGVNWIVTPQGGIQFREGLRNFREDSASSDPANDSRIFQFHKGGEQSDIIVHVTAGDSFIHFMQDGAMLATTVSHDYLQAELEDLWFTNQEKTAVILHQSHPPLYVEILIDNTISSEVLLAANIPLHDFEDAKSPIASLTASDTYTCQWVDGTDVIWDDRNWTFRYNEVFATTTSGEIKAFEYYITPSKQIAEINKALALIPALQTAGTVYSVLPIDANTYEITITGPNAGKNLQITPTNLRFDHHVVVTNTMEETETSEPAWSFPTYVLEGGVYYQCIAPNTPAVANQPPNTDYWTPLAEKPDTYDWQYPDGNPWTADAPEADPPVRVAYSPGGRGFPTVGVVYEQRLLLMATPALSMGVFGSRIGNYKDFKLGPQDDDPLFFAIDTSDSPTIKWAQAQRRLIIGTSSGDYALNADITLTPSNVQATRQNSARSHSTDGVTVGTNIFYIQQGREKMRMTGWNDDLQSQQSIDISLISQNLLEKRVKRLALMQTPEVLVFALRQSSPLQTLVCISYSLEQDSAAWTEFESSANIIDICGGYNAVTSEDELWALVTYDGGVTRWIEKMPYPARVKNLKVTPADDNALIDQNIVCLDGWITGAIDSGDQNVIQGLDQFNGLTVTAMVDDAYTGQYLVSGGAIVLDAPPAGDVPTYAGAYAVGFEYEGPGKTFEVTEGNQRGVGYGTQRRWAELTVRLLNSSIPKINGQLPEDRTPATEMSVAEIWRDGTQNLSVTNLGWGDGTIEILQDRPYPTHILGFFGKIEVEDA